MKKYRYLFLIFFLIYAIFSFYALSHFGMSWDEPAGQHIAKIEINLAGEKIEKTDFQREDLIYYGPLFEIINYKIGNFFYSNFNLNYVDSFHVFIVFSGLLGLLFLFFLARDMFNEKIAFWSVVFLSFSPQFFAHFHFNPKDIPLLTLFLIIFFFLFRTFFLRKIRYIIGAGIFFGFGLATRMDVLLILPIFFLSYMLFIFLKYYKKQEVYWKKDIKYFLFFIFVSLTVCWISWPSLWRNPKIFFESILFFFNHGWNNEVQYLGNFFKSKELPWHFSIVNIFSSFSFLVWILFFLGLSSIFFKKTKKDKVFFSHVVLFIWIIFGLIISFIPNSIRYDGVRHYLFIFPSIVLFAALGFSFILDLINRMEKNFYLKIVIVFILIIFLSKEFFLTYPHGEAYVNEIIRKKYTKDREKIIELDYWGISLRDGLEWINKHGENNSTICLPLAQHLLQFYPIRKDLNFSCQNPDYLIFFTRYAYLPKDLKEIFDYSEKKSVFEVSTLNSNLLFIFPK